MSLLIPNIYIGYAPKWGSAGGGGAPCAPYLWIRAQCTVTYTRTGDDRKNIWRQDSVRYFLKPKVFSKGSDGYSSIKQTFPAGTLFGFVSIKIKKKENYILYFFLRFPVEKSISNGISRSNTRLPLPARLTQISTGIRIVMLSDNQTQTSPRYPAIFL